MKDTQNSSAWNDWANYLLYIVKKHDGDIDKIQSDLSKFEKDYIAFKAGIEAGNKKRDKVWGIILGLVTKFSFILRFIFKI